MTRAKIILSVAWCGAWVVFALYSLLAARGTPPLRNPMGPTWVPKPEAARGTFAVLGDCHSHRRSLQSFLVTASKRAEFAILLGDFVDYDEDIAYHHFVGRLGHPSMPVFLTRGNHEAVDFQLDDSERYRTYVPETSIFFRHAGMLVGILDNAMGEFAEGCLEQAREELSAFRETHSAGFIVLAMHIPPTVPGARSTDLSATATQGILELCDEFGVTYLVCGHVHDHIELLHEQTTILIDGCGGGSLGGPSTAVRYTDFAAGPGELIVQQSAIRRDNPLVAKIDYLIHVSVPRYRWWFFVLACAIVLREACSLRSMLRTELPDVDEA